MKKTIFSLIFFIILLNFVSAQELSYEGFVYSNKFFDFDNVAYKTLISSDGTKLNFLSDTNFLIDLGNCKSQKYRKYCFNASTYDTDIKDHKAYIYIYYLKPNIKITRTVDDFIVDVGEIATFDVTLQNIGDADATDIEFFEDFPSALQVTRSRGGDIEDNSIYWKGNLEIGDTKDIEYSIKSVGSIDQYFKSKVSYFDGVEDIEEYSDQIRIYSESILDVEFDVDSEEYQINEDIDFTLTLTNNGDKKIEDINFYIYIPQSINVIEHSTSFDFINDKLALNTNLDLNQTIIYEFKFTGNKEGLAFILMDGDYQYLNSHYDIDSSKQGFLLTNEGIDLTTSLSSTENVKSNELLRFYVKLQNQNEYSALKYVRLQTITDLASIQNYTYNTVDVNQSIYLINTELRVPKVETQKNYEIKFNVTYQTQDNEQHSQILKRNVLVRPKKTLEIIPTFSKTKINEEEIIEVKVKLNNPSDKDIDSIEYRTIIPTNMKVNGATSSFVQLNATEKKEILVFTLTPSMVDEETSYSINFTANYVDSDGQYSIVETKEFSIIPKIPDVTIQKSLASTSAYLGELIDVTYTITNKDSVVVKDILLSTTKDQNFDTVNLFEKSVDRLDPGEKIVIVGEKIRPKKVGTINAQGSMIYFFDEHGRMFNNTHSSVSLNVKDDTINEALIYIQINGPELINFSDKYVYTVNFTNLGRQIAKIKINNQDEYISQNKIIKQNYTFEQSGNQTIKKPYFEYDYLNTVVRTYANDLNVEVIKKNTTNKNDLNKTLYQENQLGTNQNTNISNSEIIKSDNSKEKNSFFANIYKWFKNLFSNKQKEG